MKNGGNLFRVMADQPNRYKVEHNESLHGLVQSKSHIFLPAQKSKFKQLQFILPTNAKNKQLKLTRSSPNGLSSIVNLDRQLKNLQSDQAELEAQLHKDQINEINHMNERRQRAILELYKDTTEHGFDYAERNAKRNAQKSRLRILANNTIDYWEDFINYVYEKEVTKKEIHLVEELSKHPHLTASDYCALLTEARSPKGSARCEELLKWINKRENILPQDIEDVLVPLFSSWMQVYYYISYLWYIILLIILSFYYYISMISNIWLYVKQCVLICYILVICLCITQYNVFVCFPYRNIDKCTFTMMKKKL